MRKLSHVEETGKVRMVDVGEKGSTHRRAVAESTLIVGKAVMAAIESGRSPKGNIYETARIAGIQAAKRTWELIPLCHPIPITHVKVELTLDKASSRVKIRAEVRSRGRTGVEMEALTAVSVAALTVYDMAKAVERTMRIENVRLVEKRGGQRGDYFEQQAGQNEE